MSSLRERLLRHKKTDNGSQTSNTAHKEMEQEEAHNEWDVIEASMAHNEWGSFVLRRRVYESSFFHGCYALGELVGQSDPLMSILLKGDVDATESCLPHDRLLYLDTETTGLGIGAGNVPFMIGIGFYEGDLFVVEQMFIRNPAEELAMLYHLQEKLEKYPYLVSYNGKTFDWPIIKNRYILNRMPSEPDISGHLDFLYPSRSLWKHTLPSCRLGKVEEERLLVTRHEDVPGSLAPALYFQYLAENDVSVVKGVFIHNELDILSLAGLSVHFSRVIQGKIDWTGMGLEEQYRLGLWFHKIGLESRGEKILDHLCERLFETDNEGAQDEYLLPLAQVYKQQHRYTTACRLWSAYVERKGHRSTASLEPYIELAIHYEHREKQLPKALMYAEQALNKAWQRESLRRPQRPAKGGKRGGRGMSPEERKQQAEVADLEKRIQRLQTKSTRGVSKEFPERLAPKKNTEPRKRRLKGPEEQLGLVMDSLI
ncbi:ribonuclease H-like domain-containing protein [Paenibacillus sp. UNC451MF]|uniref:ribonuclease H-like domain-containing protein n=1 Tax=Paenibacillus sp. UNC451MF TaxID=1449063 RepID=UPI0006893CAE|nr:ribonuclease H-like domain-containing protein [Paenibacillus sp. UNC451MF]